MSWLESLVKSLAIQSFLWLAIDSAGAGPHDAQGIRLLLPFPPQRLAYLILYRSPTTSDI